MATSLCRSLLRVAGRAHLSAHRYTTVTTGVSRERTSVTTRLWQARLEAARAAGVDGMILDPLPLDLHQPTLHPKPFNLNR